MTQLATTPRNQGHLSTHQHSDYGRKLYLLQNNTHGGALPSIAGHLANLRFFISSAIEQQPNPNPQENFGRQPLPNLETRFLSANALLSLAPPQQLALAETKLVREL